DGLTLYCDRFPNEKIDLKHDKIEQVQFTRPTRSSKWGSPEVVQFTGLPAAGLNRLRYLSVAADGLHAQAMLLGAEQRDHHVIVFSRKIKSGPFHADGIVSVMDDNQFGHFPRYSEATRELFCMKQYQAALPEIVVIRNFDFDTTTVPPASE